MNRGARQDRETRLAAARKCKRLGFVRERQSTWRLPCSPKRVHLIPDTLTKCVQSCADSESCEGFGWRRPTATSNHHCYHFKPEHAQSCGADAFSHDRTVLRYKKVRMCDLQGSGSGSGRRLVERPDSDDELASAAGGGSCFRDVDRGTFFEGTLRRFIHYEVVSPWGGVSPEGIKYSISPEDPIQEAYTAINAKLHEDQQGKYSFEAVGEGQAAKPGEYRVLKLLATSGLAYGSYIAPFKLGDKIYAPDYNGCAFAIYSMPESLYSESFSSPGGLTQKRFVAVHSYRTVSASDGAFGIPPRMLLDYSGLGNEVTTASGDGRPHFAHDQRKGSIWSILQLPDEQRPKATRGWTECVPPIKTGSNPIPARAGIGEINQVFVESRLEGGKAVMYVSVRNNYGGDFKRYLRHEC